MSNPSPSKIKTRFLVVSDTHGVETPPDCVLKTQADVVIHCGDLTTHSKIHEFKAAIRFIQALDAPLKLVIAGNHDFTLDTPAHERIVARSLVPAPEIAREWGDYGEARKLLDEAKGFVFLEEGRYSFDLQNGASLSVYASPYTPSSFGGMGFQYRSDQGRDFPINDVNVVMTHGPPNGVLDLTRPGYIRPARRAGCPYIFEAVARARPQMHCFGHIHEAWGAKLVTWREKTSPSPDHFTDIDNERSFSIKKLADIQQQLSSKLTECATTSHCKEDQDPLKEGSQTLFVNAAYRGSGGSIQPPWIVDLELPSSSLPS